MAPETNTDAQPLIKKLDMWSYQPDQLFIDAALGTLPNTPPPHQYPDIRNGRRTTTRS